MSFPGRLLALISLALAGSRSPASWAAKPPRIAAGGADDAIISERRFTSGGREVILHVATFDDRRHTLRVIDNPADSRSSLAQAMRRERCEAGINGGFFHADWRPLGLMVSGGRLIHPMERARLLSGVLAVTRDGPRLLRYKEYRFGPATRDGLQAGPFLVDGGVPVRGLHNDRRERRSAVVTDGRHGWGILASGPLGLADLAEILASGDGATGFKVARALNLDGGSSTAFWSERGGGAAIEEFGYVRNFLAVVRASRQ